MYSARTKGVTFHCIQFKESTCLGPHTDEQHILQADPGTWLQEGGACWLQSSPCFPSAPIRHNVFPSYGTIVSANTMTSSLAWKDHVNLYNPGSDNPPLPAKGGEHRSSKGYVIVVARRQFPLALFRFTGVYPCA